MTCEEIVRVLTLHNGCLRAQENGECRYNHLGRCEPCRYFTDDEEFTEAESAAIEALQERKTGKAGKWIVSKDCEGKRRTNTCPFCGDKRETSGYTPKYCEECGARLEADE